MLMALLCLQNGENSLEKNHWLHHQYICFKFSRKLDKVYNDIKNWNYMFSNKFDVGIVYVVKVEIIIIKKINH
jgi:hypothetical protein